MVHVPVGQDLVQFHQLGVRVTHRPEACEPLPVGLYGLTEALTAPLYGDGQTQYCQSDEAYDDPHVLIPLAC